MKYIGAVIKRVKLQDVALALEAIPGFPGMTVLDASGMDRWHVEHAGESRREALTDFRECVRLEILAEEDVASQVVEAIRQGAHTGLRGDGLVWVSNVESVHKIRDPEPQGDPTRE